MPDVFAVADMFVNLVRRQAANDIALIVYYGSYATDTASPQSDLDLYYIPDDGKGAELYRSITYQEYPFEFWPVSWTFAERIASGKHHWCVAPSIIANAKILYARSANDEARFAALQATIARLQRPESRGEMIGLAQAAYGEITAPLYRLALAASAQDRAGDQWAAVQTIDAVLDCLALINQTFFLRNWASNLSQIAQLVIQPDHLAERIETLLLEPDPAVVYRTAEQLAADVRAIILAETRAHQAPHTEPTSLNGYYPAIKEYVNKILGACEHGNWVNASITATKMQKEFAMLLALTEDGIAYSDFNLLGEYRAASDRLGFPDLRSAVITRDFDRLASLTRQFDDRVRHYLTQRGIPLNTADTLDELHSLIG